MTIETELIAISRKIDTLIDSINRLTLTLIADKTPEIPKVDFNYHPYVSDTSAPLYRNEGNGVLKKVYPPYGFAVNYFKPIPSETYVVKWIWGDKDEQNEPEGNKEFDSESKRE